MNILDYTGEPIPQEDNFENLQELLDEAEEKLPDEIQDDYYGYASIDLLTVLADLEGISDRTKKALEDDIMNLSAKWSVQNPFFQQETNDFITRLIIKYGE